MAAVQPRRTQEARSADTREKLARAAFELIHASGFANFRVAAVARSSGVSQGGQLHHFPTKDAMTMAAIEYAIDLAQTRTEEHLAAFDPHDARCDLVMALIQDCLDYYFSPSFDVAMDIAKAASDNRPLRRDIAEAHRRFRDHAESSWHALLLAQGWEAADARDLIAMTASLARGFAIRSMIRPDREAVQRLMQRWRDMAFATFAHAG